MQKLAFTVSARTARLIGRENVSNAEGALIELVKNCYDADSENAIVLIDKPNDTILIIDSGIGMTAQIIEEQWMTIGTDEKLNNPITTAGRIKAGAKGIGRFALDRLGEHCSMITFPVHSATGFKWVVNWSDFEERENGRSKKINQVFANLATLSKTTYKKALLENISNDKIFKMVSEGIYKTGTMLKITGLRDEWPEDSIVKIFQNLELLTPPDGENKIFICLIDAREPEKFGLVQNFEFSDYDYKIVATYKKNKNYNVKLEVYRNEFDLGLIDRKLFKLSDMRKFPFDLRTFKEEYYKIDRTFSELLRGWEDPKNYGDKIGDFQFTFYFLKNSFSKDDRSKYKYKEFLGDRGAWLKKFGGLKLYRDNFRIRPYGEINTQAYDWLKLGERHGQNPAGASRKGGFRVRANQVAGMINFSRLTNPFLEDKSSREGLIESEVFEVFKNILLGIIKVQEDDRSTIFSSLLELYGILNPEQQVFEESERIAHEGDKETESSEETKAKNQTLRSGILVRDKKLKDKDEEVALSRAMASAGIMIASFSHEFHGIKNQLISRTGELKKHLVTVIDSKKLKTIEARKNPFKLLSEIKRTDEKIKQWVEFTIGLTDRDRRKSKNINLVEYFNSFNSLWSRLFRERKIFFKIHVKRGEKDALQLKISELDLDVVFDNLITNSIEAFQRNDFTGSKKIDLYLNVYGSKIQIDYKDSGPGIDKSFTDISDIFNPFETTKRDDYGNEIGTGLGMWLVKSAIDTNKGKIELKKSRTGFETKILFNAKRK